MTQDHLNVLPLGYQLHWYRLERVLGQGGFGVTYLAHDTNLDQQVAIKEYLPVEFAARASDHTVQPRSQKYGDDYGWGRDRFVSEAQTLAQFDHPNIVRAYSVFEHNNTAYMVMRYEEGQSLQALLDRSKTLSEGTLTDIVLPILDGLQAIHAAGFIHRDIKPDNILIREDGSPVLLDFGSARRIVGKTHTLTILMSPGYAPFEQYHAGDEQGPWTDIYSLAATLYHGVTGKPPVDAIARSKGVLGSTKDTLVPASKIGRRRYSHHFLQAIDHGLAFDGKDRPQTLPIWKEELCGRRVLAAFARRVRRSVPTRAAAAAAVLVVLSLLGLLLSERMGERVSPTDQQTIADERLAALEHQLAGMEKRLAEEREASQTSLRRAQEAEAALRQELAKMEKQLAEKQEGSQTISSQDQERVAALRERLAALGKDLEKQKRSEAELLARETKLREERARFEKERQQWLREKRTTEEQTATTPPAANVAGLTSPRTSSAKAPKARKVAIFPFGSNEDRCMTGGIRPTHKQIIDTMLPVLERDSSFKFLQVYQPESRREERKLWAGLVSGQPNTEPVSELARSRGADVVLMAWRHATPGLRWCQEDAPPFLMSLYLVDAESGRTFSVEGDEAQVTELTEKVLAQHLNGLPKATTGIPKRTNSTLYKVAIFPFRTDERCHGWNRPPNPEVASNARALVQKNDSLTLAYSYYDESLQSPPISNPESVWGETERPNAQRAYSIGKDSGVDVILTYWRSDSPFLYCSDNRPPYPVEIYLFDVAQQRMYSKRGPERNLLAMTEQALSEFLVGAKRKVGATAQRRKLTTSR